MKNLRNRLVFGTGSIHHLPFSFQRANLIHSVFDSGINKFDTAPAYGNGINEYELGKALQGKRGQCEINTKFGIPVSMYHIFAKHFFHFFRLADKLFGNTDKAFQERNFAAAEMEKSLHASLKRLKTDYIDTFFIHEPINQANLDNLSELVLLADRFKAEGKIKSFGIAGSLKELDITFLKSFAVLQTKFEDINYLKNYSDKRIVAYSSYKSFVNDKTKNNYSDYLCNALSTQNNLEIIVSSNSIKHLEETLKTINENDYSR